MFVPRKFETITAPHGVSSKISIEFASSMMNIRSECKELLSQLQMLHGTVPTNDLVEIPTLAECLVRQTDSRNTNYLVFRQGELVFNTRCQAALLPLLEDLMVAEAKRNLDDRILLHAGVVAIGDKAVLFPAASCAGKSTLVTAMVSEGLEYLSDEVAVINPETGRVMPFVKPLALREGGWERCKTMIGGSTVLPARRGDSEKVWYFTPRRRTDHFQDYNPAWIILPRYDPSAAPELVPISRGSAFEKMVEQSFNLPNHGQPGIAALLRLVLNAECFSLIVDDLSSATDLVRHLID